MSKKWLSLVLALVLLIGLRFTPVADVFALDRETAFEDAAFMEDGGEQNAPKGGQSREAENLVQLITPPPAPTQQPTAESTATPEPTQAPTAEPTATPEPTQVPTAEPTATPEPTQAPTAEPTATPEPTEEPTTEPTAAPVQEPDAGQDTETTPEQDPDAPDNRIDTEEQTDGLEGNSAIEEPEAPASGEEETVVTPEASQEPTAEPDALPQEEATPVPAQTLELTAATQDLYAVADHKAIRVRARIEGGMPPYSVTFSVYNGSSLVNQDETTYNEAGSLEYVYMPSEYGKHTVRIEVGDGSGQHESASVEIPVSVSERETQADWARSVQGVELTGDWRVDLVAIARTQIGYTESHRNFIITDDGEKQRYTRYGDWFGYPYEDWCAMFIAFCLNYAQIPEEAYPYDPACASLKEKIAALGAYEDDEYVYQPQSGDLVFFNRDGQNRPQHVGIVEEVENGKLHTIEGNVDNSVVRKTYALTDEDIVGYANTSTLMARAQVSTEAATAVLQPVAAGMVGYTTTQGVNIRGTTDTNSRRIAQIAQANTEVSVLGYVETAGAVWYLVQYDDVQGYIRGDLLTIVVPGEATASEAETAAPEIEATPTPEPTAGITIDQEPTPEPTLAPVLPDDYVCGLEAHAHGEDCYDESDELICALEEHDHETSLCLTYAEQEQVDALSAQLALLPDAQEIEAIMLAFEEAQDMAGLETYLRSVIPQLREAYEAFMALSTKQQAHVIGIDKVTDLEWLWSAFILYDYPSLTDDSAYVSGLSVTGSEPAEQVQLGESVTFSFAVDTQSYTDTSYGDGRVKIELVLPYNSAQAAFDTSAMTWLDTTDGYAPVLTEETRIIDGAEVACQVLTGYRLMETGELDGYAIPGSFTAQAVVSVLGMEHESTVGLQISAAMEHCAWEGECAAHQQAEKLTAATNLVSVFVPLTEEEQAQVDALNALLATLPTVDDVEAIMAAFEASDDMAGLEAYMRVVVPQFREAYEAYQLLSDRQKELIAGYDKVLDLEWFWSAFILYDYPSLTDDSAYVSGLSVTGSEPAEQVQLGESVTFSFAVDTQSYTDTSYGDGRVKIELVLPYNNAQAAFDTAAMTWLDMTDGYAPVLTEETRIFDGAEVACQVLTGYMLMETGELDGYAIPGSFTAQAVVSVLGMEHESTVGLQISAAMEHGAWEGECAAHQQAEKLTAATNTVSVFVPLTEEEQAQVDALNALLATLPTVEDVEAIMAAFEAADDLAGLEEYVRVIVPQFREAYEAYQLLSDRQKELVVGFEKVTDLEWFWSAFVLYDYPELTDDSARVSSLSAAAPQITAADAEAFAPDATAKNGDAIAYPFTVATESYTDTSYSSGRVKIELVLPLGSEQAAFDTAAMTWLDTTDGYAPVVTEEMRVVDGAEVACQVLTGYKLMETGELDGYAIPGEFTHSAQITLLAAETGTRFALQISAAMEHGVWDGECETHSLTEKLSAQTEELTVVAALSQQDWERVQTVIAKIDALPSADEVMARLAEIEDDEEAYEAYFREVANQCLVAYMYYQELGEELQPFVTNIDKLMDLSWLWSIMLLEYNLDSREIVVHQVNNYNVEDGSYTTLVYGMTPGEMTSRNSFYTWTGVRVEKVEGSLRVAEIVSNSEKTSKSNWENTTDDGFILLHWGALTSIEVGDIVYVDFDYTKTASNAAGVGTVYFYPDSASKPSKNNGLSGFSGVDTSEIIELNLYDYSASINSNWSSNNKYPGFQYPGGTLDFDDGVIDSGEMDFGDNIVADGTDPVIAANKGGTINTLDHTNNDYANRPISGAISKTLINGYPALADGTSLSYLFTGKVNSNSVNGLFQKNNTTGAYWFNSRWNNAQYNSGSDTFTLYDELLTSNYIMYPFGNFLPFNNINTQTTQASTITREYFIQTAQYAQKQYDNGGKEQYKTLADRLFEFVYLMDGQYGMDGWDGATALNKYFTLAKAPDHNVSLSDLSDFYSIDYDVPTDFFFGMDISMTFMQPKSGLTGNDGKQEMIFYFTGDDDVWVFIDDALFLDLTGIHRHVGGEIDFVKGKIYYYELDVSTGDVSDTPYKTVTFEEALEAAGVSTDSLNSTGTFKDYTTHKFNFYYMERGSGSSVCRINFNFPLLRRNTISVTKELTSDSDSVTALGNPDYMFQVLAADSSGNKTSNLFIGAGVTYNIYDGDTITGTLIGTGTTDENGVFTLKAGQTAEFTNIAESAGKYYVRELLDGNELTQYGKITVSGESTTTESNVTVGTETFTGVDSPVKDMSDGSTAFRFDNTFTSNKLGNLAVKKVVSTQYGNTAKSDFSFTVKLDGTLLPVGTAYTVVTSEGTTESRTVQTEGIILVPAGATATISNILAGTAYEVTETLPKEYDLSWDNPTGTVVAQYSISGTIAAAQTATATATNTEKGVSIQIPVEKTMLVTDGTARTFTFHLEQCDANGTSLENGFPMDRTLTVAADGTYASSDSLFAFRIGSVELADGENTWYFKLTETADSSATDVVYDTTKYLVTLVLYKDATSGEVTQQSMTITKLGDDSDTTYSAASFTNTLTGELTLTKKLVGGSTSDKFSFTITLDAGSSGLSSMPEKYHIVGINADGSPIEDDWSSPMLFNMCGGETLTVYGIPIGATYTITESEHDGYWAVVGQEKTNTVSGTITQGENANEVVFTNFTSYAMPETGGEGTNLLYIAGVLLACASAILLYNHKRRKEGSGI